MEKNVRYNMLDQVVSNEDSFCWRDLDCVYRPWTTAFKSLGEEYLEASLLLTSFFTIYTSRKNEREIPNFPLMYNAYLNDYFGIEIIRNTIDSKQNLIRNIKASIDDNCPILIPVDLFELSYNPMYMKEHRYKYMIIKGYDLERELFYILDNIHIDFGSATILTDFTSTFDEMYRMNRSFYEFFDNSSEAQHFFSIDASNKKNLNSFSSLKFLQNTLISMISGKSEYIHFEEYLLDIDMENNDCLIEITKSLNLKPVFERTLIALIQKHMTSSTIEDLNEELDRLYVEWNKAKTEIIYVRLRHGDLTDVKEQIKHLKEKEISLFQSIVNLIDRIEPDKATEQEDFIGFNVINNKKAQITREGKDIIVKHSPNTTYDTWLMQDYAVQFIIPAIKNQMALETKVDVHQNIGDDIHAGIIVKFEDGRRYLFGNYRGESTALFCPNLEEKFSIYESMDFDNNAAKENKTNSYFKVCYSEGNIEFHCLNKDTLVDECIYKLATENNKFALGLFSKTWEKLDHTVRFYDIKVL